jgi:anti-sigma-K factor RskA
MDDLFEIEAELKKLEPAKASPELMSRVESALTQPPFKVMDGKTSRAANGALRRWWPVGLAAAAAALVLLTRGSVNRLPSQSTPSPATASFSAPAAADFIPAGLTQVVYDARDEGIHFTPGAATPVRRLRSQKRETLHWRNPNTGASLRVSYPAEEVTLIPADGQ